MRRKTAFIPGLGRGLLIASFVLILPLSLRAQETAQQPASPAQGAERAETPDKAPSHNGKGRMHERHERMEAMHKEMNAELERQMTTLRAHTQTMSGITDTQQLVAEMKKHQQLSDDLLNTMIEQRQRMHAQMREHRQHGRHHEGHQKGHDGKPGCCPMMEHKDSPVSSQ